MDLSRFSRSEMLIGGESVEKLSRCHVAVFGLGGVGSYTCLLYTSPSPRD